MRPQGRRAGPHGASAAGDARRQRSGGSSAAQQATSGGSAAAGVEAGILGRPGQEPARLACHVCWLVYACCLVLMQHPPRHVFLWGCRQAAPPARQQQHRPPGCQAARHMPGLHGVHACSGRMHAGGACMQGCMHACTTTRLWGWSARRTGCRTHTRGREAKAHRHGRSRPAPLNTAKTMVKGARCAAADEGNRPKQDARAQPLLGARQAAVAPPTMPGKS